MYLHFICLGLNSAQNVLCFNVLIVLFCVLFVVFCVFFFMQTYALRYQTSYGDT